MELTIAGASALALGRKVQRFPDSHFTDVKVTLADVGGSPLGHELLVSVSI